MQKKKQWLIGGVLVLCLLISVFMQARPGETRKNDLGGEDYVAVIRVEGPIVASASPAGMFGGMETASSDRLMREFREAAKDEHAKAVLVRINSPGGSATATQEIGTEMDRLRAAGKPIIISMGDTCASGGYWMAAKGDYIYANPSTLTGSIGVIIGYTNYRELLAKLGITSEPIKSGAHKDILSPNRPMTDEERALVQDMVNDIYNQFVAVVADGRHLDESRVRELADGRIFTGRQAKELGLVDALGNHYDALAYTAERVGLATEDTPVHEYGEQNPWQQIFGTQLQSALQQTLARAFSQGLSEFAARLDGAESEVPHVR